ncbi:DUF4003 family protein [Clostridium sp.]|uniref:DUF4003 family protein n=1 Tax=Clostridium sp. TaxID=1506 RepID=UPI00260D4B0D|nr:DUF4003 family protein [Clostridium sp.]
MRQSLLDIVNLFIRNKEIMKKNFKFEHTGIHYTGSLIYTEKNQSVDFDRIKDAKDIIKNNTNMFSNFRGVGYTLGAIRLSLSTYPENRFKETLKAYELLKKEFSSSEYLSLIAYFIAEAEETSLLNVEDLIKRAKEVYTKMKKNHPFLTSSDDISLAVLISMNTGNIVETIKDMEIYYNKLKDKFSIGNPLQSLSHVLSLNRSNIEERALKVVNIYDNLKERKLKYGRNYELPLLGILALCNESVENITEDIEEVYNKFKEVGVVKTFGLSKTQGLMYASLLVAIDYYKKDSDSSFKEIAINNIITIIIQEIMVTAAMTATIVATSTSN